MAKQISYEEALIYVMVTMSAADRSMTDKELNRIGHMVSNLPVFANFDADKLVQVAEECGDVLAQDDGLDEILDVIRENIPAALFETAYAVAVDVAIADLHVEQEELRMLQLLRDELNLDNLVCAAIERGARARFRSL